MIIEKSCSEIKEDCINGIMNSLKTNENKGEPYWLENTFQVSGSTITRELMPYGVSGISYEMDASQIRKYLDDHFISPCRTSNPAFITDANIDINDDSDCEYYLRMMDELVRQIIYIFSPDEANLLKTPLRIANVLGISERTIQRVLKNHQIPCVRIGRQYRISLKGLGFYLFYWLSPDRLSDILVRHNQLDMLSLVMSMIEHGAIGLL